MESPTVRVTRASARKAAQIGSKDSEKYSEEVAPDQDDDSHSDNDFEETEDTDSADDEYIYICVCVARTSQGWKSLWKKLRTRAKLLLKAILHEDSTYTNLER